LKIGQKSQKNEKISRQSQQGIEKGNISSKGSFERTAQRQVTAEPIIVKTSLTLCG
jgi:hypothetical protein